MWKKVLIWALLIAGLAVYTLGVAIRGRDITGLIEVSSEGEKINLKSYPKGFYGLEDILDKYDVYLTGGNKGSKGSYEINKYMARFLIKNKGVKYVVLDVPHSYAEFLNKYLETGNEKILKYLFENISEFAESNELIGYRANNDEYDLMKFYYNLNRELDKDNKIHFVGIGSEVVPKISLDYLKIILKGKTIDSEIIPFINKIKESGSAPKFYTEDINHYFRNYNNEIKESLGSCKFYNGNV